MYVLRASRAEGDAGNNKTQFQKGKRKVRVYCLYAETYVIRYLEE